MANEEFSRRRRRVRWIWITAIVVLALAVGWGLLPRAVPVDVAVVDRADVQVQLVDEGRTRMHDVYVVSAPVSGRVLRVEVEPGDTVKAGGVLAQMTRAATGFLDTRTDLQSRAAVDAAAAQLRSTETQLDLARREHQRTQQLAEQRLVSASAVDSSQTRLQAAQAARDAAQADLTRARSALVPADRMSAGTVAVRSPAAGTVLSIPQKSETVVAAGSPIVELGDPTHVEVVAEFLSQDAVRMRPGQAAFIENWGGSPLPATVDRIEPVARMKVSALGVEEQRTNVILQFTDRDAARRLGHDYRVDARVVVEEVKDAVRVPLGAMFRQGDGWAVYRIVDGRAVLTPLATGIADDDFRVVTEGVEAGAQVILFPGSAVAQGQRVRARGNE